MRLPHITRYNRAWPWASGAQLSAGLQVGSGLQVGCASTRVRQSLYPTGQGVLLPVLSSFPIDCTMEIKAGTAENSRQAWLQQAELMFHLWRRVSNLKHQLCSLSTDAGGPAECFHKQENISTSPDSAVLTWTTFSLRFTFYLSQSLFCIFVYMEMNTYWCETM